MKSRQYAVTLTGQTPLLLHHDNIGWSGAMQEWSSENKQDSVAGDDRSPAWRWVGCLYVEGDSVVIPSDNLMTVIREGAKRCLVGGGRGKQSFKARSQSGMIVDQSSWPILVNGAPIQWEPISALMNERVFAKQEQAVRKMGFELFVKRAVVGASKHVRVRPRFNSWSVSGSITVFDDLITDKVVQSIFTNAGAFVGLGDWRPASPKSPGPFGKFTSDVQLIG